MKGQPVAWFRPDFGQEISKLAAIELRDFRSKLRAANAEFAVTAARRLRSNPATNVGKIFLPYHFADEGTTSVSRRG
jgi:hypothetical protein